MMRTRRAACALILAAGAAAPALSAPPEVMLEWMTSTELRDAIAAGSTTVLLPIGGTEQNGAHMVLGKHNVRVRVLAERIARELGRTVVAPVMAYVPEGTIDPPSAHMRFAGTISVADPAFEAVLESAAASLARHGFKDIVLLGDHGGYQASLARVASRWRPAAHHGARLHALHEYYRAAADGYSAWLKAQGHAAAEIGQHAGLADTALAMAADPALVRREAQALAPSEGVSGDPRRATLALGQSGLDQIVRASVAAVRARLPKP